jgi:hypothetical protein
MSFEPVQYYFSYTTWPVDRYDIVGGPEGGAGHGNHQLFE